jgi:UDP-N-acetylmuramyl tripeptide synthase
MLLSELGNIINYKHIINLSKNKEFNRVSSSSKEVNKKTIFFINNKKKIKTEYLLEALNKKTPAIISNKIFSNLLIPQFIVKDVDKEINKILKKLKPNKPLTSIAITGTNGKTSVAWYIAQICKINNIKNKMQGTLGFFIDNKKFKNEALTTPSYETLYQNAFTKKNNKYNFIFEASSHALQQDRIKNFPINIAAITNISHDHLDNHKSFLNYKKAKFKKV